MVKVGIVANEKNGYSNYIAGLLESHLENHYEVSVGFIKKVNPELFVHERFDILIIGDDFNNTIPSLETRVWLKLYARYSTGINQRVDKIFVYCIGLSDRNVKSDWIEFLSSHLNLKEISIQITHLEHVSLIDPSSTTQDRINKVLRGISEDLVQSLHKQIKNVYEK